jgi:hypothetical protein
MPQEAAEASAPRAKPAPLPAPLQTSPTGRVAVGAVFALGLYLGLRKLATGVVLAVYPDPDGWWSSFEGLVAVCGGQVVAVIFGAVLAAAPASAADKNEDKAKEAAVAFLKAVKAKDADAVVKVSAAPFAYKDGEDVAVLKDTDALKKWVKERLEELKDTDKVPTEISEFHTWAEIKEKVKNEEHRKKIEEVLGKDGYVAVIMADGKMVPVLVRIKDGKAQVVGLGRR